MAIDRPVNFDDATQLAILYAEERDLRGFQKVTITPMVRKATVKQFSWYYGAIVPIVKGWLNETQGGDSDGNDLGDAETDDWLKRELRGKEMYHPKTGEYMGKVAPMKRYWSVAQMVSFVESVIALMRDYEVKIPPPNKDWREAKAAALRERTPRREYEDALKR